MVVTYDPDGDLSLELCFNATISKKVESLAANGKAEISLPDDDSDAFAILIISWVFEKPKIFKKVTSIAEQQGKGRIGEDRDDIPIPNQVVDAIQKRRLTAITDAYSIVEKLIIKTGHDRCTASRIEFFECSGMIIGTLLQSSKKLGIFPVPDLTNTNLAFTYVFKQISKSESGRSL
ncbi:hypothetical protein EYC84_001009 [Monilinia fructicola]|uniref:Uncharacterized protein n=1 Tax=Monilinia fructicola TaxID=38448 RepID=A0A5M9JN02_MONFR|nr:hypothetical protein EYC84_001009 [Monilinia fructicola]